ncbi:hypothetical protein C8Q76DRAFT_194623 [Earliella scabrosa]|nr:hypothetical protein C8Q76DRAFT_194623 [Earliella scabrosa]
MSDQDADAALVALYSTVFTANICGNAATSIIIYDFLITFPNEVNSFWRSKWTGATMLFFLNRYVPLLSTVVNNLSSIIPSSLCSVRQGRIVSRNASILSMGRLLSVASIRTEL